ncbi:MAG: TSUP family transporter [Opitutales bacterium]
MLALTLLLVFFTHTLGGVAAFGSALLTLPLLLGIGWDLRPAVALILILGLAQSAHLALQSGRATDGRPLGAILIFAGLIGVPLGFLSVSLLPERGLDLALGLVLIGGGASRLWEQRLGRDLTAPVWLLRGLLVLGGLIHGAFGSGGAALAVYARFVFKDKETFRGTLAVMWVLLNIGMLTGLYLEGRLTGTVWATALPGIPVVFLATALAHRLAHHLSREQFGSVVAGLLCLAGVMTLLRAF